MGNSPSQGGIDDHIKSEPRLRQENESHRNPPNVEENERENRMKTMDSKGENPTKASSSIQLINKNKVHPAACSYSDIKNVKENFSRQKSSSAPKVGSVGVEPLNKLPFSDMRTENFNSEESVPWADSLIIANPLPVEECSIFSLDSLEKNEPTKSDAIFPDTLESIPLMGSNDKMNGNGNAQSPVDTITGSCKEEESAANLVSSPETGLKVASPSSSPFTAWAEPKNSDSVIPCSFTTDSLAHETSIRPTDSVVINTEEFFTLRETPITDDIPAYRENDEILSPLKAESALNINDSNRNILSLPITNADECTNSKIFKKEKEPPINVNQDADTLLMDNIPSTKTTVCVSFPEQLLREEKITGDSHHTNSDSIFIKPLAELQQFSGEILCENSSTSNEKSFLNVEKVLSAADLKNLPPTVNEESQFNEILLRENKMLSDEICPTNILSDIDPVKPDVEIQNPTLENSKHFEKNPSENFSEYTMEKMAELESEFLKAVNFIRENATNYEELDFGAISAPSLQIKEPIDTSKSLGDSFPIKLQLIDDSESVLQLACKNSVSEMNEMQSIENIDGPPSLSSMSSDNDDKTISQLIESDDNEQESKRFESFNLELREDTDADESSGVYSDLDKDNGNNSQNEYQLSENNVETRENFINELNQFEIKSDNECTISKIDSPTLAIDDLTPLNDTNDILHIYETVPTGLLHIDKTLPSDTLHIDENKTLGISIVSKNDENVSISDINNLQGGAVSHENDSLVPNETICSSKPTDGIECKTQSVPNNSAAKEIQEHNNIVTDELRSEEERNLSVAAESQNYQLEYHKSIESETVPEETQQQDHSKNMEDQTLEITSQIPHIKNEVSVENREITSKEVENSEIIVKEVENSEITSKEVENSEITSKKVENSEIDAKGVENSEIIVKEVENSKITSKKVENREIAAKEVENSEIIAKGVENSEITSKEVEISEITSKKVENGEITAKGVENSEITSEEVENSEITSKKVENSEIDAKGVENSEIIVKEVESSEIIVKEVENTEIFSKEFRGDDKGKEFQEDVRNDNIIQVRSEILSEEIPRLKIEEDTVENETGIMDINSEISEENNKTQPTKEFTEHENDQFCFAASKNYLESVKSDMFLQETIKTFNDDLKELKQEILNTESKLSCISPTIPVQNNENMHVEEVGIQFLSEIAKTEIKSVETETDLKKCQNASPENVEKESKESFKKGDTDSRDTEIEVSLPDKNNKWAEAVADKIENKKGDDSNYISSSEQENKTKEPECLPVNEKINTKVKGKPIISKPVTKRVPFSRKLIKNTVKADDAFDAVEIFVGPKRLSLAETKEENETPESSAIETPSEFKESADNVVENCIASPLPVNSSKENLKENNDNIDATIKDEIPKSSNVTVDLVPESEIKEMSPPKQISSKADKNCSHLEPKTKISCTSAAKINCAEKLNRNEVDMKIVQNLMAAKTNSSTQFPLSTKSEAFQEEVPRKPKSGLPYKDDSKTKPDEEKSKIVPPLIRQLFLDKKTDAVPSKSGRSWIPESCQHPTTSDLEKESIRSLLTKNITTKPLPVSTTNFLGSQSQQQGCVNSSGQIRNRIMSPSLSNNIYIGMNGIDAEALNALAAQEEQYLEQLQEKENLINELQQNLEQVKHKTDGEENFNRVLAEYEKTLSLYVQQIEELKRQLEEADEEKLSLIKERDQAIEDLRNVESAFSDVHRKYERAKALLENMKKNEEILVRRDQDMMIKVQNRDRKIDTMKEKVQENMEKMHQDYESKLRDAEADNARLRAQFRKMEMKLSTLENDVEQKAKENAQLSALCDELINGDVIN